MDQDRASGCKTSLILQYTDFSDMWTERWYQTVYNVGITTKLHILDLLNNNYLPSLGISQYLLKSCGLLAHMLVVI